ncbi:MAG: L-ribulose-5-phosphate 4-epimerase AraD [Oscillospiraceae bacterium]|jgi:L-ribulose-5-phosphate 4-epimerase|nr:L-ribulose-5-phosphate 4-epimerase AraD [Oscillospiraceae bacterium]
MLEALKEEVLAANLMLPELGLARFTWGNASGADRASGFIVIKPSGVEYAAMREGDLAVVDMESGRLVEGKKPSSDTAAHIALYKAFPFIGGVAHTHSRFATVFAQRESGIPPLGTTHADHFRGEVPCARAMTPEELAGDYERNIGLVVAAACKSPREVPGALAARHGPFAWGGSPREAVFNAAVLEEVALLAWHSLAFRETLPPLPPELADRHYYRKHGESAYYGQG